MVENSVTKDGASNLGLNSPRFEILLEDGRRNFLVEAPGKSSRCLD